MPFHVGLNGVAAYALQVLVEQRNAIGALGRAGRLLHDEDRVIQALFAVELEADPAGVDARAGILGQAEFVRRLPSAVEEVVGRQPQAVAAAGVLGGVVRPEPGDVGVEARARRSSRSPG